MGNERETTSTAGIARSRSDAARPSNAVLRLQKGIGNQAVGAMLARDAKKGIKAPKGPAPPYIEIGDFGVFEIRKGDIELNRYKEVNMSKVSTRWQEIRRWRETPNQVTIPVPKGSKAEHFEKYFTEFVIEGNSGRDNELAVELVVPGAGKEPVRAAGSAMPLALAHGDKGTLRVTLGLDVEMPDSWTNVQFLERPRPERQVINNPRFMPSE